MLCAAAFSVVALAPQSLVNDCRTARRAAFASHRAEHVDAPMEVAEGSLPSWLHGAFFRNGPGLFEAGDRRVEHWFDGYAMLTRVSIQPGRAPTLTTRFIDSDAYKGARYGEMRYAEFMTPLVKPGNGLPSLLRAAAALAAGDPTDNAVVNVVRRGGRLEAMTETQRSWFEIEPDTLATLQRVVWDGAEVGQLSTAHAQPDPAGGGWINVGTEISPPFSSSYHIFRVDDRTPQRRERLASIPCANRAAPRWLVRDDASNSRPRHRIGCRCPLPWHLAASADVPFASLSGERSTRSG